MAKNRKIPFGYMMKDGKITTNPKEVLAVVTIFQSYLNGESLVNIALAMEVPYNEGMTWNKNMVKRIIENEKYLGTDKYPQLIDEDVFRRANAKRVAKATSLCVISDELQEIRNLTYCKECGQRMFRKGGNTRSEKWDCCRKECYPLDYRLTDQMLIGGNMSDQYRHYSDTRYHALNLHSYFQHGHYEIRCCNASLHAGEVRAQIVLALAISNAALTKKYCSPAVSHSDNMRYSFRVWLLNLGLIGDEFKNCRTHLLKHLSGDIAWRHPEDGVAQRERLRQERIAAREQERQNASPCDERVEPVSEVHEDVGETPDENLQAAVSDCDDFEETEDECMEMSM